jgi:hypothetical protein
MTRPKQEIAQRLVVAPRLRWEREAGTAVTSEGTDMWTAVVERGRSGRLPHRLLMGFAILLATFGCGGNNVSSDQDAKRAYLGLDASIDQAIDLGFKGFNAAQSANIPAEEGGGVLAGSLTVSGQVDQGMSANKQMRLSVVMAGYSNVSGFTYNTGGAGDGGTVLPSLDMSLQGIPNGTVSGTFAGTFEMSGSLSGPVTLNLTFTGDLEPNPDAGATGGVVRKPGTTHITGTAISPAGTFTVDVTK